MALLNELAPRQQLPRPLIGSQCGGCVKINAMKFYARGLINLTASVETMNEQPDPWTADMQVHRSIALCQTPTVSSLHYLSRREFEDALRIACHPRSWASTELTALMVLLATISRVHPESLNRERVRRLFSFRTAEAHDETLMDSAFDIIASMLWLDMKTRCCICGAAGDEMCVLASGDSFHFGLKVHAGEGSPPLRTTCNWPLVRSIVIGFTLTLNSERDATSCQPPPPP